MANLAKTGEQPTTEPVSAAPQLRKIIEENRDPDAPIFFDMEGNVVQTNFGRTKRKPMDLNSRLDYACESMRYEKNALHTYTEIDFCLDDIIRIDWVCHFTNLRDLTCSNQGLLEIEGIEKCHYLERIWLTSNLIEQVACLDKLKRLKELYLSDNRLVTMKGFGKCFSLERLWLDENQIQSIEYLNAMGNLQELNLAGNLIEYISVGFDGLNRLRELNLSANRVGNFREALNLTRLPMLQSCSFSDQNYGDNPICSLCNYQTFVLFHLPKLLKLDTMYISDEAKSFAETTFMKKRMYYNMRIKTIQRNSSNIIALLKICKKIRVQRLDMQATKLLRKLQEIQREIEERQHIPRRGDCEDSEEFEPVYRYGTAQVPANPLDEIENETLFSEIAAKKALIQGRLHDREEDGKDLDTIYQSIRRKIYQLSEQNIHRLMTELETGGNIRFEEGRPSDKWFNSCVDLVRSRFHPEQMRQYGIVGINVSRVTRIHNRFLRNRFEERLEQLVDLGDSSYKRSLEYLFYGFNPNAPNEINRAMEEGFRAQADYESEGAPPCITLVNSVANAEIARINTFLRNEDGFAQVRAAAKREKAADLRADKEKAVKRGIIQIPPGQLLVCKIFLQKCVHDKLCQFFKPEHTPNEIWDAFPLDLDYFTQVQSVYRVKENDHKQRLWFVLDHCVVLPEYLVDFDYVTSQVLLAENKRLQEPNIINEECTSMFEGILKTQQVLESTSAMSIGASAGVGGFGGRSEDLPRLQMIQLSAADLDRADMGSLKRSLHAFMRQCHIAELMQNNYEFLEDENSGAAAIENSMPPQIPLRSQLGSMRFETLLHLSRQRDPAKIVYLNLFNNKIRRIDGLERLPNLQTLVLAFNELEQICGLNAQRALRKLDLAHNFIRVVQNIEELAVLTNLDLRNNWISEAADVQLLTKCCPELRDLSLKFCPIASNSSYRFTVAQMLPKLVSLDSARLTEADRDATGQESCEMTHDLILHQIKLSKAARGYPSSASSGNTNYQPSPGWERLTEELSMNHLRIKKIENLAPFTNLRKLSLLDNRIEQILCLEKLNVLEELSLEKNKLTQIQKLDNLKFLKKLDLGSNKIKRINNLASLTQLTQLSLENNEITRLEGLEDLQSLMELYLGNNMVTEIKEIMKLQDLQRLIILDISGNPISTYQQHSKQKNQTATGTSGAQAATENQKGSGAGQVNSPGPTGGNHKAERATGVRAANNCGNPDSMQYRIYCIFHLRKLRVLDGVSIDPQEHMEAKDTFSGRLTDEMLQTKLPGQKLVEVRELDLTECKLRDFADMFENSRMPALRELTLTNNLMGSLRFLNNLPQLRILRLNNNRITTLFCKPTPEEQQRGFKRGLFGMPQLEYLDVSHNCLQFLYGLQYGPLKELKVLLAAGNDIGKIEHLERLRSLRELDLCKNKIKQIEPTSFLPTHPITTLRLDENAIKSLAFVESLAHLQVLSVAFNRIGEFQEIEKLSELPALTELNLSSNPISRKQNYRAIMLKRLINLVAIDGKEITLDERRRLQEISGAIIDPKQQQPMIHFQQYPAAPGGPLPPAAPSLAPITKMPVKMNAVSFDGIFKGSNGANANQVTYQSANGNGTAAVSNQQIQTALLQQPILTQQQNSLPIDSNTLQLLQANSMTSQSIGSGVAGYAAAPMLGASIVTSGSGNRGLEHQILSGVGPVQVTKYQSSVPDQQRQQQVVNNLGGQLNQVNSSTMSAIDQNAPQNPKISLASAITNTYQPMNRQTHKRPSTDKINPQLHSMPYKANSTQGAIGTGGSSARLGNLSPGRLNQGAITGVIGSGRHQGASNFNDHLKVVSRQDSNDVGDGGQIINPQNSALTQFQQFQQLHQQQLHQQQQQKQSHKQTSNLSSTPLNSQLGSRQQPQQQQQSFQQPQQK